MLVGSRLWSFNSLNSIHSDEELTLKNISFETHYGDRFTLSTQTQLLDQIILLYSPTDAAR